MIGKSVKVIISDESAPSKPDLLLSDCLRVEVSERVVIKSTTPTKINLTIHNTSSLGRVAHLSASFDPKLVNVIIPDSNMYVGPASKSVTYAIIAPQTSGGQTSVSFSAN